jgi:hypothetical protein
MLYFVPMAPAAPEAAHTVDTRPDTTAVDMTAGLFNTYSNQRTRNQFRPRTTGKGGATSYQLRQYAEATLGGGSLRKVVKLPEGEDENEWLAVNSKDTIG